MKYLIHWIPPMTWMVIIFLFSSKQRIEIAPTYVLNFILFKSLHIIEYAILYWLLWRALRRSTGVTNSYPHGLIAFVITVLYAISDEVHQTLVPTREGKARDVIIDGIGAALSWYTLSTLLPKMPKKLQKLAKRLDLLF